MRRLISLPATSNIAQYQSSKIPPETIPNLYKWIIHTENRRCFRLMSDSKSFSTQIKQKHGHRRVVILRKSFLSEDSLSFCFPESICAL